MTTSAPLRESLTRLLSIRDESQLSEFVDELEKFDVLLQRSWPVSNRPFVAMHRPNIQWWVSVPWLAIVNARWRTVDTGVFVRFLVRSDRSGIYLTLSYGRARRSRHRGTRLTSAELHDIKDKIAFLQSSGFTLNSEIDLRSSYHRADQHYARLTMVWKFYPAEAIPEDAEILQDIDELLNAFEVARDIVEGLSGERSVAETMNLHVRELVQDELQERGFSYSDWQVATFVTSVQTKGFVILSGISGTGKTKLVQHFAAMLPWPQTSVPTAEDEYTVTVRPYMKKYGTLVVPMRLLRELGITADDGRIEVDVWFGGTQDRCRLAQYQGQTRPERELLFRNPMRTVFTQGIEVGDRLFIVPALGDDHGVTGFRILREEERDQPDIIEGPRLEQNHLFLSVRPDWRDSKALLGYYNPLTEAYEWTPFLRFLERARRSFDQRDGLAWFVVLDEMNLAHVEYYFADLLSVMESGRGSDGLTNEALLLVYPETAEGDLPPREMRLPPNLYVVGTVNIDETTHAFSPKVLDRAFSIELVDVDFSDYPPAVSGVTPELSDSERQALLAAFTREGRFPRIDKAEIAAYVAEHPEVRDRLQALNERLRHDNLHFGYRVFDEIVTFLAVAEENGMFDGLGANAAFDAAVLMKVLPKFHGSRGKLQRPLEAVLAWCIDPDRLEAVTAPVPEPEPLAVPVADYALPKTAERVQRMLSELQIDGFTAFG